MDTLLCGERDGRMIDGFDLGNSPSAFRTERIAGRTLVVTTTNGTRALLKVAGAGRGDDIDTCAVVNCHDLVPRLVGRQVRLP